ncbi:MAG: DNA translocase FtsK [Oscillospiraceae bacterium]|nr:DNA translocase FtsK [Oscillospiraceae bacterium]
MAKKNESQPIPEMDIDTAKEIENKALSKLKRHGLVKRTESDDNSPDKFRAAVLFVAMILFILLVFVEGSAGWNLIHRIIRGFFGVTSLLVPVLIGMAAWRADSDYENDVIQATPKWNIIITIIIAGAVQILFNGSAGDAGFISYIKYLYEDGIANTFGSGGVISAVLAYPLLNFLGTTGARIVIVLLLLVLMFWISKKSPRDLIYMMTHPFSSVESEEDEEDEFSVPMDYVHGDEQKPEKKHMPISRRIRSFFFPDSEDNYTDDTAAESEALPVRTYRADYPEDSREEYYPPEVPYEENPGYEDNMYYENPPQPGDIRRTPIDDIIQDTYNPNTAPPAGIDQGFKTPYGMPVKEENEGEDPKQPQKPVPEKAVYIIPPMNFLKKGTILTNNAKTREEMSEKAAVLVNTLKSFGVEVRISSICPGPSVTRYEIQPAAGVKVSKITNLANDIAMNLAADSVRIEAPIPGKPAIGIEVPNTTKDTVSLRDILESDAFKNSKSKLAFAVGKDIAGSAIVGDVAKMPHMIIAGATGSGKSVCTNSIIMSILMNATPDEVKLILIDPKIVEFRVYEGIPHLLIPVVTDPKKAAGALNWAVQEMLRRYKQFAELNVRDIYDYNQKAAMPDSGLDRMPQIVIAIDELADLMMAASKEVEDAICRLAQMARAAGMHLIIATQRPTTDIITGLIKANIPSRIALSVMSQIDSRTILDMGGAEKLLGHGDMLYLPNGMPKPVRVQGCYTSTSEIEQVVDFIKKQSQSSYDESIIEEVEQNIPVTKADKAAQSADMNEPGNDDALIEQAIEYVVQAGQASTSSLQRRLKIGYARAARIMDELESMSVIGPYEGAKPRRVLLTPQQLAERKARMQK